MDRDTTLSLLDPIAGEHRPVTVLDGAVAERNPSRGGTRGGAGGGGGSVSGDEPLLSDSELQRVETDFPDGLTSVQIVDIFTQRGIRFSEATFRKYVQQGLLPRSRRVGRKGKHKGSLGLYPAHTARRINHIKRLMAEDYTIDEIQSQVFRFRDEIEQIQAGLAHLLGGFEGHIDTAGVDARTTKDVKREIAEARKSAEELVRRVERIEGRITDPSQTRSSRAPEGAEDLL